MLGGGGAVMRERRKHLRAGMVPAKLLLALLKEERCP